MLEYDEAGKERGKKYKVTIAAVFFVAILMGMIALEAFGPSPLFGALSPLLKPTTSQTDYSAIFNGEVTTDNAWTILTPFAKTTNEYGNDVYVGTTKNKTGGYTVTDSIEISKSQNESKDHFSRNINSKISRGYSSYDPSTYGIRMKGKWCIAGIVSEEWCAASGSSDARVYYGFNPTIAKWWVMTTVVGQVEAPVNMPVVTPISNLVATPTAPLPPKSKIPTAIEFDKWASLMSMGIYKNPPQTYGFGVYIVDKTKTPASSTWILCGRWANFYIDDQPAGGKWTLVSTYNGACARSLGFTLYPEDVAKLSLGIHTLKVDFLGDDIYAPSQGSFTFTVYEFQPQRF